MKIAFSGKVVFIDSYTAKKIFIINYIFKLKKYIAIKPKINFNKLYQSNEKNIRTNLKIFN